MAKVILYVGWVDKGDDHKVPMLFTGSCKGICDNCGQVTTILQQAINGYTGELDFGYTACCEASFTKLKQITQQAYIELRPVDESFFKNYNPALETLEEEYGEEGEE